jgi:hypothetical protein
MLETKIENQSNPERKAKFKTPHPRHWIEYAAVAAASLAALAATVTVGLVSWQAAISRDTERRQLRAYVGITPADVEASGDQYTFTIVRKNYGLTPAYNMLIVQFQDVIHIGAPVPMIVPSNLQQGITDTPTLFPSMEVPYHIRGNPLSKQQSDLVRDGKEYQLIYYGILWYDDAFGAKHYTRFCYLFKGASMASKDAEACLGHNNSD